MVLVIDDNREWLDSVSRVFRNSDVIFAECHSTKDALVEIAKHRPELVLLDHQLTDGGNEGFEVVEILKDSKIKIISTTTNDTAAEKYATFGITRIKKSDLAKIREIIT